MSGDELDPGYFGAKCYGCERLGPVRVEHGCITFGNGTSLLVFICPACESKNSIVFRTDCGAMSKMLTQGVYMRAEIPESVPEEWDVA